MKGVKRNKEDWERIVDYVEEGGGMRKTKEE
jgi:hypothetical protein